MSIDLDRNRLSLLAAYQDVCDGKKNWALFGYDGNANILKLVETGKSDLDEMTEDLNSGKCMYAFCRVKDPATNLYKLVLINWSGEGAPETRKSASARHTNDVGKFFRGAHVTINARTDDEVEPEEILKQVSKASASVYNIGREPRSEAPPEHAGPVGSVYQRTRPDKEIKASVRDKFWEQTEKEEQRRLAEEKCQRALEREKEETERKDRESTEAAHREERINQKMSAVGRQRSAEQMAGTNKNAAGLKKHWEEDQSDAVREEEDRNTRAERMKEERATEAANLVGRRLSNPRAIFEQKAAADKANATARRPPPPKKVLRNFNPVESTTDNVPRKDPIVIPRGEPEPVQDFSKPVTKSYNPSQPPQKLQNRFQEVAPEPEPSLPPVRQQVPPPVRQQVPPPVRQQVPPPVRQQVPPPVRPQVAPPVREPEPVRRPEPVPEPEPIREPEPKPEPIRQAEPSRVEPEPSRDVDCRPDVLPSVPALTNPLRHTLPQRQPDSDDEQPEHDDWGEEQQIYDQIDEPAASGRPAPFQQQTVAPPQVVRQETEPEENIYSEVDYEQQVVQAGRPQAYGEQQEEEEEDNIYQEAGEPGGGTEQVEQVEGEQEMPQKGGSVRALYDYQAEDDTEISFDPDEIISDVDPIDPGWWVGTTPSGERGMFPANYVDVI